MINEIKVFLEAALTNSMIKLGWANFEAMLAFTHFLVLCGFRNSDLNLLRERHWYFLEDGFTHLISIFFYSIEEVGLFAYLNWRLMLVVHLSCWINLIFNPSQTDSSRLHKVYHWSCIECTHDRFNFRKYGIQIIGTVLDTLAHCIGFYFIFIRMEGYMKIITILSLFGSITFFFVLDTGFKFYKHMMPQFIQNLLPKIGFNSEAKTRKLS
jgi:hypothetical protein